MEGVAYVPLPPSPLRGINRQHQRLAPGSLDPRDQLAREAAIFVDVELKPKRAGARRGDFLDLRVGETAQDHDGAGCARCPPGCQLAIRMGKAMEGGWRDENWHRKFLPEQGDR